MKVFNSLEEVNVQACVATMGTFDGLHCGHKVVIRHLLEQAKKHNKPSLLITFEPHPRLVLQQNIEGLRLLSIREEKIHHLNKLGVEYLLFLPFTHEFSQMSSEEFIEKVLMKSLGVSAMVIGYDHRFGKRVEGEQDVAELLHKHHIAVERIPEQDVENVAVSSTKVRKALAKGDIKMANRLLGYEYTFTGTVVHGRKRGRKLQFPTANILLKNRLKMLPADGVYAVMVRYKMQWVKGMMNMGYKPTFKHEEHTIEVHLLDFDQTIYGENLLVKFMGRIRGEKSFDSAEELRKQLEMDKLEALSILENKKD
jgi:riboflavin kinase/FMN adenylyltransferase